MKRWGKILLVLCATLVVLLLVLIFVGPQIGKRQAGAWIAAHTDRTLRIDRVSVNPLRLMVTLRGVSLSEPGGKEEFVSFSLLRVRLSPRSFTALAPIVEEVKLVRPKLRLERLEGNLYNFSDLQQLGASEPAPEPAEPGPPPQFSLNNLVLYGGSVDFIDHQAGGTVQTHQVRDLELSVPAVGNLPFLAESNVVPRISARINDAPFVIEGKLKPFSEQLEASAEINLEALELPRYLDYVPTKLPVRIPSGKLTTELTVLYRVSPKQPPVLQLGGNLTLTGLALQDGGGRPLAFLPFTRVAFGPSNLLASRIALDEIRLYGPEVFLHRDAAGVLNVARLGVSSEKKTPAVSQPKAGVEKENGDDFVLHSLRLRGGLVRFVDEAPSQGFKANIGELDLDVSGLRLGGTEPAGFELSFLSGRKERGRVIGELLPKPLKVKADLALTGIPLAAYYPYAEPFLTAPVEGTLGASATLAFDEAKGAVVSGGKAELLGLKVSFGTDEGVQMDRIALEQVGWSASGLELGRLSLGRGNLKISRLPDGSVSALGLLRPAPEKIVEAPGPDAPKEKSEPLKYRVGKISLEDLDLVFRDRTPPEEARIDIDRLAFSLEKLSGSPSGESPFSLSARVGKVGDVKMRGALTLTRPSVRLSLATRGLPLTEFVPYIRTLGNVELVDGRFDTDLFAFLDFGAKELRGDFSGELGLRRFHALDTTDEDLLRWESLQLEGIKGKLSPFALDIKDVSLSNYLAKVVIGTDGTINLQHLQKAGPRAETPSAPESPKAPEAPAGEPAAISLGALTLQGGTLQFEDRHLPKEFVTTMYNLGGRVGGISSLSKEPAEVDLRGNLENHSPLSITGRINPLGEKLFADLKIAFTDIELTAISPYTGTYLGYLVSKGKLHLDLDYKIDGTLLEAGNRVFLDQFTLGSKVQSDQATSLPIKLAIALLKDGKGEIHLDLSVTGHTDDPQFSVFNVVVKILKNLLVKAATSPFKLLGAVFGGSGDFSTLAFTPGSAVVDAAQKQSLAKLVEALKSRPALKLEISGYVDRDKDPEGYRNALLEKKMRKLRYLELLKKKELPEGVTAETVEIPPKAYSDYLWEVYQEEDFAKPRNLVGMVKHLDDDEMKKLIFTHTTVGEKDFAALAAARVEAVRTFLTTEAGLAPERIFLKQDDIFKTPADKEAASRVEFGMGVD